MSGIINRQVDFLHAQIFSSGDTSGDNNTWRYRRAPNNYLFLLDSVEISTAKGTVPYNIGIYNIVDGHEYTHWNIWPGVETREVLARGELSNYVLLGYHNLNGWECKEYTLAVRSNSGSQPFKACFIVWYRLKKASRLELLEYAVKHPKNQDMFRHSLRGTTVEPTED